MPTRRLRFFNILILIIPSCYSAANLTNDFTLKDKVIGHDVVCAVIKKISDSGKFPEDKSILRRIAVVESKFGQDKNTFRSEYYGGIWQIDDGSKGAFTEITQYSGRHPNLHNVILPKIKEKFGIDIKSVKYSELVKPFYSGLFARMLLYIKAAPIPEYYDIDRQANYWKTYYNSKQGKGTIEKFKQDVTAMEKEFGQFCDNCQGRMNLAIVMDASGSILKHNYEYAKKAVVNLIDTFSNQSFDIGFVVFSADSSVVFSLSSNLTRQEMKQKILNSRYLDLGTCTDLGINEGVAILNKIENTGGIPKVLALFTDGQPNCGEQALQNSLNNAAKSDVTIISIGIGSQINDAILEKIAGSRSRVLMVTSYEALSQMFKQINSMACSVPQNPAIGDEVVDTLIKLEKRYYKFQMTNSGITIKIKTRVGKTHGYYSYSYDNPTSALNDGQFTDEVFIPPRNLISDRVKRGNDEIASSVFVTIQGLLDENEYNLDTFEGYRTINIDVSTQSPSDDNEYNLDSFEESQTNRSTDEKSNMLVLILSCIILIKFSVMYDNV